MEKHKAERYPLAKDFDFGLYITGQGGSGTLLIPKEELFVPKNYGFGLLSLMPYLQERFNEGREFEIKDLLDELEEEGELILGGKPLTNGEEFFLNKTLRRFERHGLVEMVRKNQARDKLSNYDLVKEGRNYRATRVFSMNLSQPSSDVIGQPISFKLE